MYKKGMISMMLGITIMVVASCAQNNPIAPTGLSKMGSAMQAQSIGAPGSEKVASGQVTITKGMFYHQEPLVISDENGQAVFQAVHLGHWDIYVELFNAQGVLIYAGAAEAVVKPKQTTEVMVTVTDDLGSITPKPTPPSQGNPPENNTSTLIVKVDIPVPPIPEGLIFWNKLGSADEVANSMLGVDGVSVGFPNYAPVMHGYGVGFYPSYSTYIAFDNLFPTTALTAFAVEFWTQWKYSGSADYAMFTAHSEVNGWGNKYFYIAVNQDISGDYYIDVTLLWNFYPERSIQYIWKSPNVFQDNVIEHLGIVVDLSRESGGKIRLFRDGVDMGAPDARMTEIDPENSIVFPVYVRVGQSSNTWTLTNYVDNLKIWNYPKTDFSDRFIE